MILLVSHDEDDHLAPMLAELASLGSEAVVVDTSGLPGRVAVAAEHGPQGDRRRLRLASGDWLDLDRVGSGWWRRPLPPPPDSRITDPAEAVWAANETYEALAGFWDGLPIAWVSPPKAIETAMMKTWQLPAARAAGLEIPRTLVTSDPGEARAFVDRLGLGQVICKAFSATEEHWRETRRVGQAEYDLLDRVELAPVIFQELVPAEVDLRVTVVGEEVFAAAIHSQELSYPLDFRMFLDWGAGVRMTATTLPDDVTQSLLHLLKAAGLRYGAVDMRRTPDGRHVFLEVNPAGQWRFVEEVTGQQVTRAMARLLTDLDATRHPRTAPVTACC
ncbi:ATP-grasp ribosomal peptide maturase [Knoellia locipacati]|uniref:ATP-grasp ribosomal peptide maturase n=1 Tax=Knoellia locipacati TaxID=882824 RepID=A0A512SZ40_9MICO|nr:alpha-L-glutamate ligase [Knoellia locipacati]GEQ13218.1 ATP-grasp ribosomal peptide maturase [Knoellia locipacati]